MNIIRQFHKYSVFTIEYIAMPISNNIVEK